MLLFAKLLAFCGILNLTETTLPKLSEISFKKLLDTCTKLENLNSKYCQYFISTYRWLYDDVHLVFDTVLEGETGSPAEKILEARLIHLIEKPNFNLLSLGLNPMNKSINRNHEPLAIAIWTHLKKYENDSSDWQFQVCSNNMGGIIQRKMLQLLTKIVTDRPDCLKQVRDPIQLAIRNKSELPIIVLLDEHGAKITPYNLFWLSSDFEDILEWAIRKYPSLLSESIAESRTSVSIEIWKLMKRENYSNLLLQICNETIIHAVNDLLLRLVKVMYKDFPECIHSKGDILMEIAIRRGMNVTSMIPFLNERGVEITPGLVLRDPLDSYGDFYSEMILFLNDIGVKITQEHLKHLSTHDVRIFEWARLNTNLSKETFISSPINILYWRRVVENGRLDLIKKILDFNALDITSIDRYFSSYHMDSRLLSKNTRDFLLSHIRDKRVTNCNDTIIYIVNSNLVFLLKAILEEFPECILLKGDILMHIAIRGGMKRTDMISFLNEHGVEITPGLVLEDPFSGFQNNGYYDIIFLLNFIGVKITPDHFQHLPNNTIRDWEWERLISPLSRENLLGSKMAVRFFKDALYDKHFEAAKNIFDLGVIDMRCIDGALFSTDKDILDFIKNYVRSKRVENCNDTIIHVVNSNMVYLAQTIHKEFPECINLRGDILMDVAIIGGMDKESMIPFLKEREVEVTPGLVLDYPITTSSYGHRDMILFLNDIGVKITQKHLQYLSTYKNIKTFEWAKLNSHLSRETFRSSPVKKQYFVRAIEMKRSDLIKKILDFNVFEMAKIETFIFNYGLDEDCLDLLKRHVRDKKEKNRLS